MVGAEEVEVAWVVADRFFVSTYAYQIAGHGLHDAQVRAATARATGGLLPDRTLLLTVSHDVAAARRAARGQADRLERYGAAFDARVAAAYAAAATPAWQAAHPECGRILAVAADGPVAEITARLVDAIVEQTGHPVVLSA